MHSPRESISNFGKSTAYNLAHICPACNYCFDDGVHLPYNLECNHKVCKNCLLTSPYVCSRNETSNKFEVTCPKDHHIFEYEAG